MHPHPLSQSENTVAISKQIRKKGRKNYEKDTSRTHERN